MHLPARLETRPFSVSSVQMFGRCRIILLLAALAASIPASPQAPPPPAPTPRFVVVLDAAHGGDDLGARLGNQSEKDYTLALSVKLRSLLMARGMSVVTTRESGAAVDAFARAE